MREQQIREWLSSLADSLGSVRSPVSERELRAYYESGDYAGMLLFIRKSMGIDTNLRIAYVNAGGPKNAPGWVTIPEPMPMFGTKAFRSCTFDVYIRKSFLEEATFGMVVVLMAHELAHIVIESVGNPYKRIEPVVDLTAMYLGYSDFFRRFSVKQDVEIEVIRPEQGWFDAFVDRLLSRSTLIERTHVHTYSVGYLSEDEREYAAELMRLRSKK